MPLTIRMTPTPPAPTRLASALPPVYAAAAFRAAMPLFMLPLLASRIGADAFGRLGFILVWSSLLATLIEGGFLAAATRLAVHADPAQRWQLARRVFSARCALSLPAAALAVMAARWASPDATHPWADAAAIAALACALGWPASWYLQATQQLNRWARVEVTVYALLLAACWGFATSVAVFVLLQLAASAFLAWAGWRWLRRDLAVQAAHQPLWSTPELVPGLRLGAAMLPVALAGAAYSFALPAAAAAQMARAELGVYFLADRIVRVFLAAAEPVFAVVYPRIVLLFAHGVRTALGFAARWAVAGALAGAALLALAHAAWPWLEPLVAARAGGLDAGRLASTFAILAWLWPLLLGWKFFGYWMLGSRRYDAAYRTAMIAGGIVGVTAAASWGGARGAVGLAWTALGVEGLVIVLSVGGVWATQRLRSSGRPRATGDGGDFR